MKLSSLVLVFSFLAIGSCSKGEEKVAEPLRRRVDSIKAPEKKISLDAFCDVRAELSKAPEFHLPELASEPSSTPKGWRWINVWATWCKPCIEEMPRLAAWKARLEKTKHQ
ncbi:MAG: hypothetical protein IPJ88_08740 [Myxococcales bacterium]|nr:MAG: hypothetical protein IPJ88_08740 [Myxococcales bacterium]